jgi:ATP-dependent RNA circularization protein (DNA/RNA ligase family)
MGRSYSNSGLRNGFTMYEVRMSMFQGNGFLSEEGKKVLQPLRDSLKEVMTSADVRSLSVQELHILQANLASLVGTAVSDAIVTKNKE